MKADEAFETIKEFFSKQKNYIKVNKGITLIALVITIIVLLILAGVTIASLTGSNGLLEKATEAREAIKRGQFIEEVKILLLGEKTWYSNDTEIMTRLRDYFAKCDDTEIDDSTTLAQLKGADTLTATESKGGHVVTPEEIFGEKVTTAKSKLIPNESGTTDAEKSPYVWYYAKDGSEANKILCRVLNNDENGIDIVSNDLVKDGDTVVKFILGKDDTTVTANDFIYTGSGSIDDDAKKAIASYNRAISTLNEKAESYRNKTDGIADKSRCIGSHIYGTEDNTEMYSNNNIEWLVNYGWNGLLKKGNSIRNDSLKMEQLNIHKASSGWYWIARRVIANYTTYTEFRISYNYSGATTAGKVCRINSSGVATGFNDLPPCGIRPVFHLSDGVIITGGTGTETDPYILGK